MQRPYSRATLIEHLRVVAEVNARRCLSVSNKRHGRGGRGSRGSKLASAAGCGGTLLASAALGRPARALTGRAARSPRRGAAPVQRVAGRSLPAHTLTP
jgi:hypothetical protein